MVVEERPSQYKRAAVANHPFAYVATQVSRSGREVVHHDLVELIRLLEHREVAGAGHEHELRPGNQQRHQLSLVEIDRLFLFPMEEQEWRRDRRQQIASGDFCGSNHTIEHQIPRPFEAEKVTNPGDGVLEPLWTS